MGAVLAASLRRQVDLGVYVLGARHLFSGDLYRIHYHDPTLLFTYPPFGAFIYEPLRWLPDTGAQVVAAIANVALLVLLLAVSLRAVRPMWPRDRIVVGSLLVSAPAALLDPLRLTFTFGQVNLIVVTLVMVDLTTDRGVLAPWLPRGVLTGIAAAIKLTPLIFVPYLVLIRRWWTALWAGASFLACGLLLALLAPEESHQYWTKLVFQARRTGGVSYVSNQSLWAVSLRLTHGHPTTALVDGLTVVIGVSGLALALWAHRTSSPLLGLLVCATTGLLVSPVTWTHHMVWVIPVIVWLALAVDRPAHGPIWAGAVTVFFWWSPIWEVPNSGGREYHWCWWQMPLGDAYFIAMIVFLAAVAVLLTHRRRHPITTSPVESTKPSKSSIR
jgi:alpha-1,2-mannosyltransferase